MRGVRLVLTAVVAIVLTVMVLAANAGAGSVLRVDTDGVATAFFGGCDFVFPPAPLSCHETYVLLFREARADAGGSVNAKNVPWGIFLDDYDLTFTSAGPDAVPNFSNERVGFSEIGGAEIDLQHLDSATVVDAQVPMSDGSTLVFTGSWTRSSDVMVYGNNGPENQDEGLLRHTVDACSTDNNNAHQKLAFAHMDGTLNGVPIHSYTSFDFGAGIAEAHYRYITATHGACS